MAAILKTIKGLVSKYMSTTTQAMNSILMKTLISAVFFVVLFSLCVAAISGDDYDGFWGIWDEPFLQYTKDNIDEMKEPFFSTVFTVSSHEPYVIPEEYKDKFPL